MTDDDDEDDDGAMRAKHMSEGEMQKTNNCENCWHERKLSHYRLISVNYHRRLGAVV